MWTTGTKLIGIASLFMLFSGCKYYPGSRTEIPFRATGVWHRVEAGDTIARVASKYKTRPDTVADLNDLADDEALRGRTEIFVPTKGGSRPGTGEAPRQLAKAPAGPAQAAAQAQGKTSGGVDGQCRKGADQCLAWPATGEVATIFGERAGVHHDGIDIRAKRNSPISAAAEGNVLYSGNEIKGYGNLVIIRHKNELLTIYAHNERNLVKEGEKVKRGEPIALLGQSGSAPAPQLHFEVRQGDEPKDPLIYLAPVR